MNDLPDGYRWATEDEIEREDAIVVPRTADRAGKPYTHGEADLAVPFSLSDCVNWDLNSNGDCAGRVEEVEGNVVCETCRNMNGTVKIYRTHFLESEIVDGEYGDDAYTTTETFDGLMTPGEAATIIVNEGLTFAATGNEWAADPDGSHIVNYRDGGRVETTAHLSNFPDWAVNQIIRSVG